MGLLSRKVFHGGHENMLVEVSIVGFQWNQRASDDQASSRQQHLGKNTLKAKGH